MERALIAIASAMITGAIFLAAFLLLRAVWPLIIALVAHPYSARFLLPIFFGAGAILFAILGIIFQITHDMLRSLAAISGAVNMAFLFGVNSLLRFLSPWLVKHHLTPATGALIFAGPLAIWIVVEVVILRRMAVLNRRKR
ncbi:MAG TPA: hypothetical protein VFW28_11080 [Micropepsaceae bacterium]|nr:hypothetical protein [Micropepsaceae bacterium]